MEKTYKCNFCQKTGMKKDELYKHLAEIHPKDAQTTTAPVKNTSDTAKVSDVFDIDKFVEDNALRSYTYVKKQFDLNFHDAEALIIEIMRERQALYTTELIQKQKQDNIKEMRR